MTKTVQPAAVPETFADLQIHPTVLRPRPTSATTPRRPSSVHHSGAVGRLLTSSDSSYRPRRPADRCVLPSRSCPRSTPPAARPGLVLAPTRVAPAGRRGLRPVRRPPKLLTCCRSTAALHSPAVGRPQRGARGRGRNARSGDRPPEKGSFDLSLPGARRGPTRCCRWASPRRRRGGSSPTPPE